MTAQNQWAETYPPSQPMSSGGTPSGNVVIIHVLNSTTLLLATPYPQSCIESSLYKLNALAFITQKLYLKGSTHSFLKIT